MFSCVPPPLRFSANCFFLTSTHVISSTVHFVCTYWYTIYAYGFFPHGEFFLPFSGFLLSMRFSPGLCRATTDLNQLFYVWLSFWPSFILSVSEFLFWKYSCILVVFVFCFFCTPIQAVFLPPSERLKLTTHCQGHASLPSQNEETAASCSNAGAHGCKDMLIYLCSSLRVTLLAILLNPL